MTDATSKIEKKERLPKGQRKHVRRMKQNARRDGTVYNPFIIRHAPAKKAAE
jgi:hypothetical protein